MLACLNVCVQNAVVLHRYEELRCLDAHESRSGVLRKQSLRTDLVGA